MNILLLSFLLSGLAVDGFAPPPLVRSKCSIRPHSTAGPDETLEQLERRFQEIATKLRTSIHGNGFDSRDAKFGVESIRAVIPIEPSLGLELAEVAHSTTHANRGLVLISGVSGNAALHTSIQQGDTLVGVSCQDFRESTTGLDYDATMDAIVQAKTHAELLQEDSITLQLNRLVPRAPVAVRIVDPSDNKKDSTILKGLAGDNIRLLLKQNNLYYCSGDCGGERICGSDMIEIIEGAESVDYLGSSQKPRRKACQTIVGRDNQECTIRIRLLFGEQQEPAADAP